MKQVKCLLGGKRVRVDRHTGGLRGESRPRGSLNHFYGTFLPGFLWPIILLCLVLSPYLVHLRVLPCVRAHLLAKVDSSEEACGYVGITYYGAAPPPFLTSKEPFCTRVVGKVSLTENEEYVVFYLLSGRGPASSLTPAVMEFLSTGKKLQLFSLGPIYLLPQNQQA